MLCGLKSLAKHFLKGFVWFPKWALNRLQIIIQTFRKCKELFPGMSGAHQRLLSKEKLACFSPPLPHIISLPIHHSHFSRVTIGRRIWTGQKLWPLRFPTTCKRKSQFSHISLQYLGCTYQSASYLHTLVSWNYCPVCLFFKRTPLIHVFLLCVLSSVSKQ